jgi:CheY-like chemotaxis protein
VQAKPTGKEAVALASIGPLYVSFSLLMLPDMSAFELLDKFSHHPRTRTLPFFVLMKDELSMGIWMASLSYMLN